MKHILIFSKKNFIFYIFDNHKTKRVKLNVGFASQFRRVLSNSKKKIHSCFVPMNCLVTLIFHR